MSWRPALLFFSRNTDHFDPGKIAVTFCNGPETVPALKSNLSISNRASLAAVSDPATFFEHASQVVVCCIVRRTGKMESPLLLVGLGGSAGVVGGSACGIGQPQNRR